MPCSSVRLRCLGCQKQRSCALQPQYHVPQRSPIQLWQDRFFEVYGALGCFCRHLSCVAFAYRVAASAYFIAMVGVHSSAPAAPIDMVTLASSNYVLETNAAKRQVCRTSSTSLRCCIGGACWLVSNSTTSTLRPQSVHPSTAIRYSRRFSALLYISGVYFQLLTCRIPD